MQPGKSAIRIALIDPSGELTSDYVRGQPCVQVGFKALPKGGLEALPSPVAMTRLWALVDTGATYCTVDETLVDKDACPPVFKGTHVGFGDRTESYGYDALVRFPSVDQTCRMITLTAAMSSENGQPWRLVLGRNLLQDFQLVIDRNHGLLVPLLPKSSAPARASSTSSGRRAGALASRPRGRR